MHVVVYLCCAAPRFVANSAIVPGHAMRADPELVKLHEEEWVRDPCLCSLTELKTHLIDALFFLFFLYLMTDDDCVLVR